MLPNRTPSMLQFQKFLALANSHLDKNKLDQAGDMFIAAGRELQAMQRNKISEPRAKAAAGSGTFHVRPRARRFGGGTGSPFDLSEKEKP